MRSNLRSVGSSVGKICRRTCVFLQVGFDARNPEDSPEGGRVLFFSPSSRPRIKKNKRKCAKTLAIMSVK